MLERFGTQLNSFGPLNNCNGWMYADGAAAHLDILVTRSSEGFAACLMLHLTEKPGEVNLVLLLEAFHHVFFSERSLGQWYI